MAKRGPMPNYKTIDDYIAAQSSEAQPILTALRNFIRAAAPDVIEVENYKVPTFTLVPGGKRDQQIMMAAYKKFVSFYPFPDTLKHFEEELSAFKLGKGAIQFPFDATLPKDLIMRMVKHRKKEILKEKG